MKYIKKMPAIDKELSKKLVLDGWKKLREPSNLVMAILLSLPLMIISGIVSIAISIYLYPSLKEILSKNTFSINIKINLITVVYIIIFLVFMAAHEFIHAFCIPNGLKSEKVYWGINSLFAFVYTTEKIKKNRYLVITIMPFILLSILLPFILKILGLLNGFTIFLCLVNSMGSSVDLLNVILILTQVPKGSYIVSNGSETYFK